MFLYIANALFSKKIFGQKGVQNAALVDLNIVNSDIKRKSIFVKINKTYLQILDEKKSYHFLSILTSFLKRSHGVEIKSRFSEKILILR